VRPCLRKRKLAREITGSTLGATEFASVRPIGSEKRSAHYGYAPGAAPRLLISSPQQTR